MTIIKKLLTSAVASAMIVCSAQAEISNDTVKIGYLVDMSGPYRDLSGPNGLIALEMAVADFGGKVGGAKVEVVSADDRNNPDSASSTVRRWVEYENVDLVTGFVASSVTLAVINILEENDKLGIVSGSASSSITNEHCTPNHIHYVYDSYPLANGTATAVVNEGGKSWFILTADYSGGHELESNLIRVVEASGGEVVQTLRHPFPTPDFSSFILQAQASGADVVALSNAGSDPVRPDLGCHVAVPERRARHGSRGRPGYPADHWLVLGYEPGNPGVGRSLPRGDWSASHHGSCGHLLQYHAIPEGCGSDRF